MAFYIGSDPRDKVIDSADNLTYQSVGGRGFENINYYGASDSADYGTATDDQVINNTLNNIFNPRETGEGWRNYYDGYLGASTKLVFDLEDLYLLTGISHREDNVHYFNFNDIFSKVGDELTNLAPKISLSTSTTERTDYYAYIWRGLSGSSGWERGGASSVSGGFRLLPYDINTTTAEMSGADMINFEIWLYNALDANIATSIRWKAMFMHGSNDIPVSNNGNIWIEGFGHYRGPGVTTPTAEKHTKMNFTWGDNFWINNLIIAGAQADYTPT